MTLRAIEPEPLAEGIMDVLEPVLEAIKEGRVSALACAVVYRDGCPDWAITFMPNVSTMLGTIDRMHAEIVRESIE